MEEAGWVFPVMMGVVILTIVVLIVVDEPRQQRMSACREELAKQACVGLKQEYVPKSIYSTWCTTGRCDISFKCFDGEVRVQQKYFLAPSEVQRCEE